MRRSFFAVVLAVIVGCAGDDTKTNDTGTPTDEGLTLEGEWTDDFGTAHVITLDRWTQQFGDYPPYVFEIDSFGADSLIARNGDDNGYNPGDWSRFDWVFVEGDPWVCQIVFDAADADAAAAAPRADDSDLDAGCGGFPFTHLTPATP